MVIKKLKKFWKYMWEGDSLLSYILSFAFAFLVIKYLFFPGLGLIFGTDFPVVAIVSGSMEHKVVDGNICGKNMNNDGFLNGEEFWNACGQYYEDNYNLSYEEFENYRYSNGLNVGDVMILYGKNPEDIEEGEILIFKPQDKLKFDLNGNFKKGDSVFFNYNGPVIHRVVEKWQEDGKYYFQTKGDHNKDSGGASSRSVITSEGKIVNLNFDDFERKIPQEDVIGVAAFRIPYIGYVKILFMKFLGLFGI
jgi:hypothetical protein